MDWTALPPGLRSGVEERLGGPVVRVDGTVGGFSVGFAGVVRTARRAVFVKATSEAVNSHGRALYNQEWHACRVLARNVVADGPPGDARNGRADGAAPRPGPGAGLGHESSESVPSFDPGFEWGFDWGKWTVLAFRAVDADICSPSWPYEQLEGVLRHLRACRSAAPDGLPPLDAYFGEAFSAWAALAADPSFDGWPTDDGGNALLPVREWLALSERARRAFAGDQLLHADLRADNILWTGGAPVLVDWAYACRGAAVFDPLYLLLEVAYRRAAPPEDALARVLQAYGCPSGDANALLAVFGGWFTWMAR
ncbi:phosphotransferase family protein, partial [Streptomyces rameus]|uniref:phosphotransferase family protein n=1 Tax=Streptomyces rameus TaxID=68261 RepID=UPI0031EB1555